MSRSARDGASCRGGTLRGHAWAVGARIALAWAVMASAVAALVERRNGDATLNFAHAEDWGFVVLLIALAVAGLVVVEGGRAPKVGRLLLGTGAGASTALLAHATAVAGLARGYDGAAVQGLVWVSTWLFVPTIGLLLFVPAFWPEDRIASSWLRVPTALAVCALCTITVIQAFSPDHLDGVGPGLATPLNPLGLPWLGGRANMLTGWGAVALGAYGVAVLVDLVLRYSRGTPRFRAQLRPLIVVLAALPLALAAGAAVAKVAGGDVLLGLLAAGAIVLVGGLALALIRSENAVRSGERAIAQRRHTVEMAERERRKLRRDLHDGLGPGLAAVGLQLEAVREALPAEAQEAGMRLGRVEDTLTTVLEELRTMVDGLRPATLDELGLRAALVSQGRAVSSPGPRAPDVEVTVDPQLPSLPDAVEVALVRVAGEALTNAVRHGAPTRCTVTLGWAEGQAVLQVQDDGTGIEPGRVGHGLATMRERVEELGGRLTVGPTIPHGTAVTAVIPVSP